MILGHQTPCTKHCPLFIYAITSPLMRSKLLDSLMYGCHNKSARYWSRSDLLGRYLVDLVYSIEEQGIRYQTILEEWKVGSRSSNSRWRRE